VVDAGGMTSLEAGAWHQRVLQHGSCAIGTDEATPTPKNSPAVGRSISPRKIFADFQNQSPLDTRLDVSRRRIGSTPAALPWLSP